VKIDNPPIDIMDNEISIGDTLAISVNATGSSPKLVICEVVAIDNLKFYIKCETIKDSEGRVNSKGIRNYSYVPKSILKLSRKSNFVKPSNRIIIVESQKKKILKEILK
jgi:hypothetical protein